MSLLWVANSLFRKKESQSKRPRGPAREPHWREPRQTWAKVFPKEGEG